MYTGDRLQQEIVKDVEENNGKGGVERESLQQDKNGKLGNPHQEGPKY